MGHRIGLEIVAEGIETESSFLRLQAAGCTTAQGYWIARPMPLESYIELLQGGRRWPAGAIGLVHMATLDHLEWRRALIDALLSNGEQVRPASLRRFEIDPRECRLGRWYRGAGRELARGTAYRELDVSHVALHDCARRIIEAFNAGATITDLLPLMRHLTERSTQIIGLLQELEHEVLSRMTELERIRTQRVLTTHPPAAE